MTSFKSEEEQRHKCERLLGVKRKHVVILVVAFNCNTVPDEAFTLSWRFGEG